MLAVAGVPISAIMDDTGPMEPDGMNILHALLANESSPREELVHNIDERSANAMHRGVRQEKPQIVDYVTQTTTSSLIARRTRIAPCASRPDLKEREEPGNRHDDQDSTNQSFLNQLPLANPLPPTI